MIRFYADMARRFYFLHAQISNDVRRLRRFYEIAEYGGGRFQSVLRESHIPGFGRLILLAGNTPSGRPHQLTVHDWKDLVSLAHRALNLPDAVPSFFFFRNSSVTSTAFIMLGTCRECGTRLIHEEELKHRLCALQCM